MGTAMDNEWEEVATHAIMQKVTETDTGIYVEGHGGVVDVYGVTYPKADYRIEVSDWIRVYKRVGAPDSLRKDNP